MPKRKTRLRKRYFRMFEPSYYALSEYEKVSYSARIDNIYFKRADNELMMKEKEEKQLLEKLISSF